MKPTLKTALALRAEGLACIPVGANKVPTIGSWREFMETLPTREQLEAWYANGAGIAVVAGAVLCVDVDEKYRVGLMVEFEDRVRKSGLSSVWDKCLIQSTPSGGYHLVFRSEGEPFRNMKLASKANNEVLIETRGKGGYFLIPPSEGYTIIQGDYEFLPVLTADEVSDLLDVARSFDERAPAQDASRHVTSHKGGSGAGLSPGDDYDQRGDFKSLMRSHGWVWTDEKHLRRPGKSRGVSASFDVIPGRFWCFSSSTEFETEKVYRPYAVYAILEHGGDFGRAIAELARQGYGEKRERKTLTEAVKDSPAVVDPKQALERAIEKKSAEEQEAEEDEFDLKRFDELERADGDDLNNILGDRFLCKGSCAILFGYSGIGKSSLVTQLSICWAIGKETLGLKPSRPLNILLIQAENDEGDLAEMRDGGVEGLVKAGVMNQAQAMGALPFIYTLRVSSKCGAQVGPLLEKYAPGFDLVILDPLFAYLGGDALAQKDVSFFLRNVIDPVISRLNVALMIIHHTNKPPKEGHGGTVADMAYLSAGSAELTNYPRGILAVLPTKKDHIYQLVAAKRGGRLGWGKDHEGKPRRRRFIGHSDGYICWREIDDMEIAQMMAEEETAGKEKENSRTAKALKRLRQMLSEDVHRVCDLHEMLMDEYQLGSNGRIEVIKMAEQSLPNIDRVKPSAGRSAPWLIGPTEKVARERLKMEQEFEAERQQKIIK